MTAAAARGEEGAGLAMVPVLKKRKDDRCNSNHNNHRREARKSTKPGHELWLVIDQGEAKARWVKLTGLWPTQEGDGLAGQLQPHLMVPPGSRLVIKPVRPEEPAT